AVAAGRDCVLDMREGADQFARAVEQLNLLRQVERDVGELQLLDAAERVGAVIMRGAGVLLHLGEPGHQAASVRRRRGVVARPRLVTGPGPFVVAGTWEAGRASREAAVWIPVPPFSVSLPSSPVSALSPLLPVMTLARSLPVPEVLLYTDVVTLSKRKPWFCPP